MNNQNDQIGRPIRSITWAEGEEMVKEYLTGTAGSPAKKELAFPGRGTKGGTAKGQQLGMAA